jgi:hypothetical protein
MVRISKRSDAACSDEQGWIFYITFLYKCRGREYLRIVYGPEYTAPTNLDRLRSRGVSAKRSLASREFALGIEALEVDAGVSKRISSVAGRTQSRLRRKEAPGDECQPQDYFFKRHECLSSGFQELC